MLRFPHRLLICLGYQQRYPLIWNSKSFATEPETPKSPQKRQRQLPNGYIIDEEDEEWTQPPNKSAPSETQAAQSSASPPPENPTPLKPSLSQPLDAWAEKITTIERLSTNSKEQQSAMIAWNALSRVAFFIAVAFGEESVVSLSSHIRCRRRVLAQDGAGRAWKAEKEHHIWPSQE